MRPFGISKVFGLAIAAALLGLVASEAAPVQNRAEVRAVRGTANYSTDRGANWKKLNVGTRLGEHSILRTAPGSTVDLFLGDNGPVVRVTEDTTLGIDRLNSENMGGGEKVIETQLDLRSGRILGNVKKLAAASKYEVKTPVGVAGIRGTKYDIRADGTVAVTEGTVVVVYIVGGQPTTVTVPAGFVAHPPTAPGGQVQPEALTPEQIAEINGNIPSTGVGTPETGVPTNILTVTPIEEPQRDPINNTPEEEASPFTGGNLEVRNDAINPDTYHGVGSFQLGNPPSTSIGVIAFQNQ